jgi:protein TonB
LRAGITGTVLLEVLVGVDGSPLKVTIHRSSGNRELDRAAQQQVQKHWRFRPASRNGAAVQAIGIVPIDFKLD